MPKFTESCPLSGADHQQTTVFPGNPPIIVCNCSATTLEMVPQQPVTTSSKLDGRSVEARKLRTVRS